MSVDHPPSPAKLHPVPKAAPRDHAPGRQLLGALLGDIASGTVALPSPDHRIAQRIHHGIGLASHGRRVARLLAADPALSAKALRAACSGSRLNRPRSLPQVVDRLDRHYVSGLVAAATDIDSPFDHQQALRQTGRSLWLAAMRVSAISYLLASLDGRFDAEEAALAGLLHNLGELALLGRASQDGRLGDEATRELHDASRLYGAEAGGELARAWGFPVDLVQVAETCGMWFREHTGPADMADLVLVAQLHARLGQRQSDQLPALHRLPAFHQLDLGDADPTFSLSLLEAANNALALTQRQLDKL